MKLDNQILLEFYIELQELITEREGMIVQNTILQHNGRPPGYVKYSFDKLGEK